MVRNVVKNTKPVKTSTGVASVPNVNTAQAQGNYGVSKVGRLSRSTNAVRESKLMRASVSNDRRLQAAKMAQVKEVAGKVTNVVSAASAAWTIIGATWILYMVQLVFSVLSIVGMASMIAIDGSWLQTLDITGWTSDFGSIMTYVGMGVCGVMGIFTLIIAIMIFLIRQVSILRSYSIFIMAICFALNFAPIVSFIPWIWLWCLYVVKSQADTR